MAKSALYRERIGTEKSSKMERRDKPFRLAKTTPPRIKRIYPRTRLLRWLEGREELSAIWISAPAGSGKTTLVADYLSNHDKRYLWFQLDTGDADPATFFHYLGQAARTLIPGRILQTQRLLPNQLGQLEAFVSHYFETLYSYLKPPAILVFDNFQELPTGSPLYSAFKEALKEIPAGIQIIFLSRNTPPAWFASLLAARVADHMDWSLLRLTEKESQGIARLFEAGDRHKHPKALIASLHRRARGWAAGLVLMLQAIENEDVSLNTANGCARETIFNYFANELFDKADPEEQDFLLKSALLPRMSYPAVTEFTDHQRAESIFQRLLQRNYFITYRGGENRIYEYHPLFREFLLSRGLATWNREQRRTFHLQAARTLLRSGQPEPAIDLLLLSEAWEEAIRTIIRQAPLLLSQGRLQTLGGWLARLPHRWRSRSGWLNYWQAMCLSIHSEPEAEKRFSRAFSLFAAEQDATGMYLSIADALRLLWITQHNHRSIDSWLKRFERIHPQHRIPSPVIEAKVTANLLMGLYFRKPTHPLLPGLMKRARYLWQSPLDLDLRWQLGVASCHLMIGQGELLRWIETIQLFEPVARRSVDITPEVRMTILVTVAYCDLLRGEYIDSIKRVEEGLALAGKAHITILENWLLATGAAASLVRGELHTADGYLNKMNQRLSPNPPDLDTALYQILMSWRAMLEHEPSQAKEHAHAALEIAVSIGSVYPVALCRYALAHALFAASEHVTALRLLEQAPIPWVGGIPHRQLLYYCTFSKGCFLLEMGDREKAMPLLHQALSLGRKGGFGLPLWLPPARMETAFHAILEQNIEVSHVQHLIRQAGILPQNPVTVPEQWPVPIRVFTLGRFALQLNGEPLATTQTKNRPLELLKAIIAMGGEDIAQEKLIDALWPDADGDTALKSLHTTLHRLRKLLGIEESVILKDGYLSLDPRHVWVDIRCLEQVLDRINQALAAPDTDPDLILTLTSRAERLFKGPFLGSEAGRPWSIAPAERLRNRLIRTILTLGRYWEEQGNWERAADCYRCGLQLDPLAEIFYRSLMRACFKSENHAEALATYEQCRKVLASSLGIMPGEKTVRLYQTILDHTQKAHRKPRKQKAHRSGN